MYMGEKRGDTSLSVCLLPLIIFVEIVVWNQSRLHLSDHTQVLKQKKDQNERFVNANLNEKTIE